MLFAAKVTLPSSHVRCVHDALTGILIPIVTVLRNGDLFQCMAALSCLLVVVAGYAASVTVEFSAARVLNVMNSTLGAIVDR